MRTTCWDLWPWSEHSETTEVVYLCTVELIVLFSDSVQALSVCWWISVLAASAKCPGKWKSVSVCKEWKTSSRTLSHEERRNPAKDIQCLGQQYGTGRCSQWLLRAHCSSIIKHSWLHGFCLMPGHRSHWPTCNPGLIHIRREDIFDYRWLIIGCY